MTGGSGKGGADLELSARASVRSLRFERVPETETRFLGDVSRRSFSRSRRRNLPEKVQRDVEYHDVRVEWRVSGWIEDENLDHHLGKERRKEV